MEFKAAKWRVMDKAVRIWKWIVEKMPSTLYADSKSERRCTFLGFSSCTHYFAGAHWFLSSLQPPTAKLWQGPPCNIYFSLPCIQNGIIFTEAVFSWLSSALQFAGLHSSSISPSVQIWAPWTDSWNLKSQGIPLLVLLWHFVKAITHPLPSKYSLPQTIYVVSICTLIGNCLG